MSCTFVDCHVLDFEGISSRSSRHVKANLDEFGTLIMAIPAFCFQNRGSAAWWHFHLDEHISRDIKYTDVYDWHQQHPVKVAKKNARSQSLALFVSGWAGV